MAEEHKNAGPPVEKTHEEILEAMELEKESSEGFGGEHDPVVEIMCQCLSDAYQLCEHYNDEGKSRTFHYTEIALALFRKATEGDERRELTAIFERVAKWWMDREEKATEQVEASRAAFESSITAIPKPVPRADPIISGLRSVVNCLMDIVENGTKPTRDSVTALEMWRSFTAEERCLIREQDVDHSKEAEGCKT